MDLQQEAFGGRLSWRRFLALVGHLPADSAYGWWLRDRKERGLAEWDESEVSGAIGKVRGGG